MKRSLYSAQYEMNPTSTEKLPPEYRSGDTLPDADMWDCELEQPMKGSVQSGVSMIEPMHSNQPKINRAKRND